MPIVKGNPAPPFNIIRLSHIELAVKDLGASRAFYEGALGMAATAKEDDRLYLRGMEERNHHSFILRRAERPVCNAIGFKVGSEEDLEKAAAFFSDSGLPIAWPERPHQGRTLRTADVHGMPLEFVHAFEQAPRLLQRYGAYRGCHPQRIDHVNCFTPDVQTSHEWWAHLGFRLTEYTDTDDGAHLWAVWMHRKGNIHDGAFTNGRGPRLHHVAIWVPTALNIIHLCDALSTTGYLANMERGPGRHGISNAFFLYVRDPDGHRIELYTSDYLTVDPDLEPIRWALSDAQRQTLWGAPAPKSWFEEGSVFPNVEIKNPILEAKPIVAP
jgi:catechol 2,3-dioxygenase